MIRKISSVENTRVRHFRQLYRKKFRDREGLYVIEGANLLKEALSFGAALGDVFLTDSFRGQEPELTAELEASGAEMYVLPEGLFSQITDTETPQGVAAVVEKPLRSAEEVMKNCRSLVVLDRLQDPGNLGTIVRTADAAGFDGIIAMKGTADIFAPKTVRAAAGAIYRVEITYMDEPDEAAVALREHGITTVCTSPYAEKVYYDVDLSGKTALIIGNEANGACDEFMRGADINVTIPMSGATESLNAGIAAAVIMFESLRQKNIKG